MHWHVGTLSWLYPAEFYQRSATVTKRKSSAHAIAMAEMVVHSAQIQDLLLCHLILSISNQTQDQLHTS